MSKHSYEYMEHSADIKFKASGINLEEVFTNASYALTDIIIDHDIIEEAQEEVVKSLSKTKEALLYDYLEELIILIDKKQFFVHSIKKISITKKEDHYELEATLIGDCNTKIIQNVKTTEIHKVDAEYFEDEDTDEEITTTKEISKDKYSTQGDVKAVTYHEMEIVEEDTGLVYAIVVIDV